MHRNFGLSHLNYNIKEKLAGEQAFETQMQIPILFGVFLTNPSNRT